MTENAMEKVLQKLDIDYSYGLAKRMERIRSNPKLGFRTAGSSAERETGQLLYEEMKRIGLSNVRKDEITLDAWEFKKAELTFSCCGEEKKVQLGAYQTEFVTEHQKPFQLVYAGRGTKKDYESLDVTGKLVLIDINQRDEWWISLPVYQAYLKGAKAVIAVQDGGYGEIDEKALNAQNIAGPKEAAAFSISRADARYIKEALTGTSNQEITVWLDADSRVRENQVSYNIVGEIPGKRSERKFILSAHYDSYFDGFQDDNAAIGMIFGMAKAIKDSGYEPDNTILILALAAEEWGVTDSPYDWSTGAYEEVFTVHPEWTGSVVLDMNFELPARIHGRKGAVRGTYEYQREFQKFVEWYFNPETKNGKKRENEMKQLFPDGFEVLAPIETWSDDFSMSIAGIPSMVNEFSSSGFMETHYHSQFDSDAYYDEEVYRFHHQFYTALLLYFDSLPAIPFDFSNGYGVLKRKLEEEPELQKDDEVRRLTELLEQVEYYGKLIYDNITKGNHIYRTLAKSDQKERFLKEMRQMEESLLQVFKMTEDDFVSLDWQDTVLFPHELPWKHRKEFLKAEEEYRQGRIQEALEAVYRVANGQYAFLFEKEVYEHFTSYALEQSQSRLKWGYGRIRNYENVFGYVKQLLSGEKDCSFAEAIDRQEEIFTKEIRNMQKSARFILKQLESVQGQLETLISIQL